jgi:hypothetical protein
MNNEKLLNQLKKSGISESAYKSVIDSLMINDILKGYRPITTAELIKMTDDEKSQLLSLCLKHGKYRCHTIGIKNVNYFIDEDGVALDWSDNNGDPDIYLETIDKEINNIEEDNFSYGLYKKIE